MIVVDLVLGADVDAAGGLVEDQHVGVGEHPLARARPSAGCRRTACRRPRSTVGRLDVHARAVLLGDLRPPRCRRRSPLARACSSAGRGDRRLDVVDQVQAVAPCGPRWRRRCRRRSPAATVCARDLLAVLEQRAADAWCRRTGRRRSSRARCGRRPSARRCRRSRRARTVRLALVDHDAVRVVRVDARSSPRSRSSSSPMSGVVRRVAVLEVAADHAADDPVLVDAAVADLSSVSIVRPSRMIVMASAICSISLSLWLIMIEVMPWSLQARSRSSRCSESSSFRAAVGSSRMSSLTSLDSALAISTSCCLPTPMSHDRRQRVLVAGRPGRAARRPRRWRVVPVDDAARGVARCRGRCSRRSTGRGSAPAPGG